MIDLLRRELLLVTDVARVETFGERVEAIYVELSRERMAQLGIPESAIIHELQQKNLVSNAGRVRVGSEFITLEPTGGIHSVEQFESILVRGGNQQIYLRDVGTVRRGYVEPQRDMIRHDGHAAIGLGISTVSGGNVVEMGEALERRMNELRSELPFGIEIGLVSAQSKAVVQAIDGFVLSLVEAVVIVVIVLLFFMGLRSSLLIGFVLVLTILGSFLFLAPMGVALERISLGALIIALGMLVDNAIVVVDGMLIRLERGEDAAKAASAVVHQSAVPLLGATLIAILAFAVIGTSDDSTGKIQARWVGPDADVLRRLAIETEAILEADPDSKAVRTSWRERVKGCTPCSPKNRSTAMASRARVWRAYWRRPSRARRSASTANTTCFCQS